MNIAFDIGGVLSKYPTQFIKLIKSLAVNHQIFVITDMHDKEMVAKQLSDNGFAKCIPFENINCADYQKFGEFCKAVLLKKLKIDIFFDDFVGYIVWDSALGEAPIRLLVAPDGFSPYWHKDWKTTDKSDFGRRVATLRNVLDETHELSPPVYIQCPVCGSDDGECNC